MTAIAIGFSFGSIMMSLAAMWMARQRRRTLERIIRAVDEEESG